MTNIEMAIAILAKHREARMWADDVVAADMLAQLGVDPTGIVQMTEAEVVAAEAVAKEAADRAAAYRAMLDAAAAPGPEQFGKGADAMAASPDPMPIHSDEPVSDTDAPHE
jgi:hypothetical protein